MKFSVPVLIFLVIFGCSETHTTNSKVLSTEAFTRNTDTIVGKKVITHELPGSANRKRATSYFIVVGKDTSDFQPIFTESKQEAVIGLHLNISYIQNDLTHRHRILQLTKILSEAKNEYDIKSLRSLYLGNLTSTGDLAINVTNQYLIKFKEFSFEKNDNYYEVSQFLVNSQLGQEFNDLLRPYGIFVEGVNVEKLHFVPKKEFLKWNKVETDTITIPNKILDCFIGIKLNEY